MATQLADPFWTAIRRQMAEVGLQHQFDQILATGRLANFSRAAAGATGGHSGRCYDDSDVYKWLEACAYASHAGLGAAVEEPMARAIATIAAAQGPGGYVHTWNQLGEGSGRWSSLSADHEAYCLGHLIEAGVAHKEASGSSSLFEVADRAAACLEAKFGEAGMHGACGHQEAEIALARLARATGNEAHRALGARMVSARGRSDSPFRAECAHETGPSARYRPLVVKDGQYDGAYCQDHAPLEECGAVVGHAVRAMYYFCGAMDCVGDDRYDAALRRLWENLVSRRMYVTGGIGSAGANEGFTSDYDLPNRHAYAETCAAIGLVMWAWRMARRFGSAEAVGVMLRALYNAVLSGVSADARGYFYANPLESQGEHFRKPWFECACCPPNIARLVLSVQRYLAWSDGDEAVFAAPVAGRHEVGQATYLVESDYPWGGEFAVRIEGSGNLRIADPFQGGGSLSWENGAAETEDGWLVASGLASGTVVRGRLGHSPEFLRSHPLVPENAGRVAVANGPIVYCAEATEGESSPNGFRVDTSVAPRSQDGGLEVSGSVPDVDGGLYRSERRGTGAQVCLKLVPYHTWSNRGPSVMRVWLAER